MPTPSSPFPVEKHSSSSPVEKHSSSSYVERIHTGIYGGSFNPIHLGHTRLGEWLVREGYVDELWFLVSPLNPLKADTQSEMLPDELRLHLAQLAVEGSDVLRVSDFELSQPRPSYMVHTLEALRHAYPHRHFHLVIGADNWHCFTSWKNPDEILRHHPIIIYPREGYPIDPLTLPPGVLLAHDAPLFPVSSTAIRTAISQGSFHGEWLSPSVWQEIQHLGLFNHT